MLLLPIASRLQEWTLCNGPPASGNVLSWEVAVKAAVGDLSGLSVGNLSGLSVGNLSGLSVRQVDTATLCSPSSAQLTILPFERDFRQV
jgi:hypothetical protein